MDSAGNAYMAGNGGGLYFPTQDPYQAAPSGETAENVILAKFNPAGSALVYSTFLGGSNNDSGYAIAVDSAGNAYVTGGATSTDFPTVNAIQTKFGSAGENQGTAMRLWRSSRPFRPESWRRAFPRTAS